MPVSQKPRKARNRTPPTSSRRRRRSGLSVMLTAAGVGVIAVSLALLAVFAPMRRQQAAENATPTTLAPDATTTSLEAQAPAGCPKSEGEPRRNSFPSSGPPDCLVVGHTYKARVTTDAGAFVIALDPASAPKSVNTFVVLARYHFYDDLTFHSAVPGFFIQSGDPTESGVTHAGFTFDDRVPEKGAYKAGGVAMANQRAGANGSQFLILAEDAPALQPQYPLFGHVVEGQDVIRKIANDGGANTKPVVTHRLLRVQIIETV